MEEGEGGVGEGGRPQRLEDACSRAFARHGVTEKRLVWVQAGTFPLLLTVPHDGLALLPGVRERSRGVKTRDTRSAVLADELRANLALLLNSPSSPAARLLAPRAARHLWAIRKRSAEAGPHPHDAHHTGQHAPSETGLVLAQRLETALTGMRNERRLHEDEDRLLSQVVAHLAAPSAPHDGERWPSLQPYVVVAGFHRRFCDVNRPIEEALEDPKAAPYYRAYHDIVAAFVEEVRALGEGMGLPAILLDIHGQAAAPVTTFRGTKNGRTVAKLLRTYGTAALSGKHSILGRMETLGFDVCPSSALVTGDTEGKPNHAGSVALDCRTRNKRGRSPSAGEVGQDNGAGWFDGDRRENGDGEGNSSESIDEASCELGREDIRYDGGYTVRKYGSHNEGGIDAIQLEIGNKYRTDLEGMAIYGERLAESIVHFYLHHLSAGESVHIKGS